MQLQGEWLPYTETICSVDPSGRGTDETAAAFLSQRNGFIYLHEMRAYKDGYSDNTLLDILRGCKKFGVTKLLIETNFGDGIVAELFRKHLQQTKQAIDIEEVRANVRKEDRIIDALSLFLINISLLLVAQWWNGTSTRIRTKHQKTDSYICCSIRCHACVGRKVP